MKHKCRFCGLEAAYYVITGLPTMITKVQEYSWSTFCWSCIKKTAWTFGPHIENIDKIARENGK